MGNDLKSKSFSLFAIGIWLLCIGSLLGIRIYKGKKPRYAEFMINGAAIFRSLNDEEKTNIARFDTAILRLSDESFHLVGRGYESEEDKLLSNNKISLKRIEFRIADPILLERKYMVGEVIRTLNEAEKKCLQDHFASIIYRNGDYFFCYDNDKYSKYVLKYGTECKQSGESAEISTSK